MRKLGVGIVIAVVATASSGCTSDGSMMGPSSTGQTSMMPGGYAGIAMVGVSPAGGASGVASNGSIEIRFSAAMPAAMAFQVDLHLGDLSGPTVAMTCVPSADRTRLTCSPATALQAGTRYVTHVGGGTAGSLGCGSSPSTMMGGQYNSSTMMGGQWVGGGGMSTSTHGSMSWGAMGGWADGCGGYGMAFPFTTA